MATQYALKSAIRECGIHKSIRDVCAARLQTVGYFKKDEVLQELGYTCIGDAIRWDYLREFIEGDQECQLIPLAEPFFKRHKHTDVPATYIALGRSKKAVGYASVTEKNGSLAIRMLEHKQAVSNDASAALEKYILALRGKALLTSDAPELLLANG